MGLDDKVDCKECKGKGRVIEHPRTIHELSENVCANAMYSDFDLYKMTEEEVDCKECKGRGYIIKGNTQE